MTASLVRVADSGREEFEDAERRGSLEKTRRAGEGTGSAFTAPVQWTKAAGGGS
jgi:hypothetical protein